MSTGDGKIILQVKVDESGITKGANSIKSAFDKVSSHLKNTGTKISNAFANVGNSIKTKFSALATYLKGVMGQIFAFLSVRALINFTKEASEMALTTQSSIQRLIDIYGAASKSVGDFIDANAHALGMSKSAAAQFSAVYGNLFSVWADQKTNAEMTQHYLRATAIVASKTGRTMEDVQERIRSGLLGNTEAVEDLGIFVNVKTIEMTEAFRKVAQGAKWDSLTAEQQSQVRSLAILEQATLKYGNSVANTAAFTKLQYRAAFEDFKNTWGQVVNIVLMPILRVLTTIFNMLSAGLRAFAGLSGKTVSSSPKSSGVSGGGGGGSSTPSSTGSGGKGQSAETKAIDAEEKAIRDKIKALQKENKQIRKNSKDKENANKKELASFDELEIMSFNQQTEEEKQLEANEAQIEALQEQLELLAEKKQALQDVSAAGSSAGGVGVGGGGFEFGEVQDIDAGAYSEKLATVGMIAGWALVGLGIILICSGHPFWGIGMVLAGGVFAAGVAEGAKSLGDEQKKKLEKIGTIVGAALIGLGVLVLFTSFYGVGLAMIASGAMALFTSLMLGEFKEDIKKRVTKILAITGTVMIVLGVILMFIPKMFLIGLAVFAAGAAEVFAASLISFEDTKNAINDFFKENWGMISAIASALVVLGIILCFAQQWLVGLGLISTGLGLLYQAIVPNWGEIKQKISEFFADNWGAIALVSSVLMVLGILLCIAQHWLVGLGLIAAGAVGLYQAIVPNWDKVKKEMMEFFKDNQGVFVGVGLALVVLGILLLFTGAGIPLGLGLLVAGGASLAAAIAPNWNYIVDKVKETWGNVKKYWNENIAPIFTLEWWATLGKNCINGLSGAIEKGINFVIDKINTLSYVVPDWVPGIGGEIWGFNMNHVSIPRLAQGAVIPGGREFLAVLGDQPAGQTNIEAPLDTIVQAFNIALAQNGGVSGRSEIILEIDGRELGRATLEHGNEESRRIGTRLVIV